MFISKCLVSKKGPLGAIWVAAYFFKKMKKSQISETNISSSVDNILQNQLEILAYRVLAYLLLGVVRIYSKKVEYLFDDCQEVLVKINEFVVREKKKAKKEALRATSFSITRPLSFDLDAFDLEVLEDTSRDNVVSREQITLQDVAWKNAGTSQYFAERIAALDDDFLMDYIPTEGLSCHLMDIETEASIEKLRYDNSFHEKVSHLNTFSGVEEEPPNLVKVFNINDREHVEVRDMDTPQNHLDREANQERYNDRYSSEECANLQTEAELDSFCPFKLKPISEDQTYKEMMKGPHPFESENEMNQVMEEDHENILEARATVPEVAGSASREKCNDRYLSEECANLQTKAELDSFGPHKLKPIAEDQTYREMMKGPHKFESENEAMEEDHESILEARSAVPDVAGSASREKCNDRFPSEEGVDLHTEAEDAEEQPLIPFESLVEDQGNRGMMKGLHLPQSENEVHRRMEEGGVSINANIEVPGIAGSGNHIGREANRENCNDESCQEHLNHVVEEKSPALSKPFGEEQTKREKMKGSDRVQLENEVHTVMEENCNLGASVKKLQAEGFSQKDLQEPSPFVTEEIQMDAEPGKFPEMRTSKNGKCRAAAKDHSLSVTLDSTQSMLRDASGATTPHFMLIPTPAIKELARFSRKRKCLFDDVIVFPNNIMRQWIKDASDLVSKRVKDRRTAFDARRTCCISNLPQSFSEPSVPCTSELKTIYSGKRLRLLESVNISQPPEQMDSSEPPAVGGSFEQAKINPVTVEMRDSSDVLNLSRSPPFDGSSEQAGIAPQTPIQQSTSLVGEQIEIAPQTPVLHSKSLRPFGSPKDLNCDNLDEVGPNVYPTQSIEKDCSLNGTAEESCSNKNDDLDLNLVSRVRPFGSPKDLNCDNLDEVGPNVDPTQSIEKDCSLNGTAEKESCPNKNDDLDLNLDVHSNEDDNHGHDGWSSRTRMVASKLQRSFLDHRRKGEEEKVNLSQLLEGKTKKTSARLFYEILVLKSKGFVDVQQEDAFDDILVLKAPQWTDIEL